jgi:Chalcone isomerase like
MNPIRAIGKSPTLFGARSSIRGVLRQQPCYQCRQRLHITPKLPQQATLQSKPKHDGLLDPIGHKRKAEASLAAEKRKFYQLALATVVCMAITYGIAMNTPLAVEERKKTESKQKNTSSAGTLQADSSKKMPESFQGAPVSIAPGSNKVVAHTKEGDDIELVPTGTSTISHFPRTIWLEGSEYTLLGLGVRTVSFLSFEVYVVGLYATTDSLSTLQTKLVKAIAPGGTALIAGEKDELRKMLADGESSYKVWDEILRSTSGPNGVSLALRIAPTRNTDFHHLRDGWVRGITSRSQLESAAAAKDPSKNPTEYKDESFGKAMKEFQNLFQGKGKAPKGSIMFLTRDIQGGLEILYQTENKTEPESLGQVKDERIARLIWLGYLGGKNVSSEPARKSIVDGVIELVERPVGTAATRII